MITTGDHAYGKFYVASSKPYSEDAWAVSSNRSASVVDGESLLVSSDEANYQAASFASRLSTDMVTTSPERLQDSLARALSTIPRNVGCIGSAGLVSWDDETVACAVVADAEVWIVEDDSLHRLTNPSFKRDKGQILALAQEDIDAGVDDPYVRVYKALAARRESRNDPQDPASWVVSDHHDAMFQAHRALVYSCARDKVTDIAVLSDGAAALCDTFKLLSPRDLVASAKEGSLQSVIYEAEMLADTDRDRVKYPRFSHFDDVCFVSCDVA